MLPLLRARLALLVAVALAGAMTGVASATTAPPRAASLLTDVAQYAASRSSTVSVAVYDETTGHRYRYRSTALYDGASIAKVNILETVLWRAQNQHRWLTAWEQQRAVPMIRESDNDAATELWEHVGKAQGVGAYDRALGLTGTQFNPEGHWGLTASTARDQLTLVRAVGVGAGPLNARSRQYVRTQMAAVQSDQRWGIWAGPDSGVQLKNGWLARSTHGWRVHSIGHVRDDGRDYSIAVLTSDNASMYYGVATIQGLSRIVFRDLAPAS